MNPITPIYCNAKLVDESSVSEVFKKSGALGETKKVFLYEWKNKLFYKVTDLAGKVLTSSEIPYPQELTLEEAVSHLNSLSVILKHNEPSFRRNYIHRFYEDGEELKVTKDLDNRAICITKSGVRAKFSDIVGIDKSCSLKTGKVIKQLIDKLRVPEEVDETLDYINKNFYFHSSSPNLSQIVFRKVKNIYLGLQYKDHISKNRITYVEICSDPSKNHKKNNFQITEVYNSCLHGKLYVSEKAHNYLTALIPSGYFLIRDFFTLDHEVGDYNEESYTYEIHYFWTGLLTPEKIFFDQQHLSSRFFLTPKSVPSSIDSRVRVSKFMWGVTLLTHGGKCGNHALAAIEGIADDDYFNKYSELRYKEDDYLPFLPDIKKNQYFMLFIEYNPPITIKNIPPQELRWQTRSEIWMRDSERVKAMIDDMVEVVLRDKLPTLSRLGRYSIFTKMMRVTDLFYDVISTQAYPKEGIKILNIVKQVKKLNTEAPPEYESCFSFLRENFKKIDIYLESKLKYIILLPTIYTQSSKYYKTKPPKLEL